MAKRFIETTIWKNERWFRLLKPNYKLAYSYIRDNGDHAGLWKLNVLDLLDDIGIDALDIMDFINQCNIDFNRITGEKMTKIRVQMIDNELIWITDQIQTQCEGKLKTINPAVAAVCSSLEKLAAEGVLFEAINKGFINLMEPYQKTCKRVIKEYIDAKETLKDKDIEKDRDKDKAKERDKEIMEVIINLVVTGGSKRVQGGKKGDSPKNDPAAQNDGNGAGEANGEQSDPKSLIPRMASDFISTFPKYPLNPNIDYPALREIAEKIALAQKWVPQSIYNGKLEDTLKEFGRIRQFCKNDKWFKKRSISDLNNEWPRLLQSMNAAGPDEKDKSGGYNAGQVPYNQMK